MSIQSITVQGGQPIYIPKNATVIAKYTTGGADAESDCVDLDNVEELACYGFAIPTNSAIGDSVWAEPGLATMDTVVIQGVPYLFTLQTNDGASGSFDTSELIAALQTVTILGSAAFNWNGCFEDTDTAQSVYTFIYLRTTPSIAAGMYLKMIVGIPGQGEKAIEYIPLLTDQEIIDMKSDTVGCTCATPS